MVYVFLFIIIPRHFDLRIPWNAQLDSSSEAPNGLRYNNIYKSHVVSKKLVLQSGFSHSFKNGTPFAIEMILGLQSIYHGEQERIHLPPNLSDLKLQPFTCLSFAIFAPYLFIVRFTRCKLTTVSLTISTAESPLRQTRERLPAPPIRNEVQKGHRSVLPVTRKSKGQLELVVRPAQWWWSGTFVRIKLVTMPCLIKLSTISSTPVRISHP